MQRAKFHDPEIQAIADEMDAAIRAEKESPAGRRRARVKSVGIAAALVGLSIAVAGVLTVTDESLLSGWYGIWLGAGAGLFGLGGIAAAKCWD